MFASLARSAAAAALLGPSLAHGFWILTHNSLTHERLDPLVSPGVVSSHVHNVIGASNFAPETTFDSLQGSSCTTSPVQADLSNYWAPQLYHHDLGNDTFTLIPISFVNTYYLNRDGPTQHTIQGFPKGLRMLAGNMFRTEYNASNVEDLAVSFVCLDYASAPTGNVNTFPKNMTCPDGVRAQITFPSCWDGKNLDSDDHKSHMSYPVGGAPDSGDCPATHPTKLITLFNEWVFDVGKFPTNDWVFSFGDETGLGMHADFISGWNEGVLNAAVEQCTGNLFGNLEACPPFAASLDRAKASNCTIAPVVEEQIDGPLRALPGCNKVPLVKGAICPELVTPAIRGGPGASTASSSASATPVSSPPAASASSTSLTGAVPPSSALPSPSSSAASSPSSPSAASSSAPPARSSFSTSIAATDLSASAPAATNALPVAPSAIVQAAAPAGKCKAKRQIEARRSRALGAHKRRFGLQHRSH